MLIKTAMILAAGRGVRMRELTDETPKPLLKVQGREMINHITDHIVSYGIHNIVVNTCYKGEQIKEVLSKRKDALFSFSDEKTALETGGGVKKALPLLLDKGGENGFFVLNGDPLWSEPNEALMKTMADAWDPNTMDILLAIAPMSASRGDTQKGNYFIENGKLRRIRSDEQTAPYFFMSVQIMHPRIFENTPAGPFSSRDLYDIAQSKGKLAHIIHDGIWFNLNTPEALIIAEEQYHS
ncbi:MAG: nucleotidyltransferase family protein [Alphaproteobacteria bacterium]|nr:nucleotidyltransferase family protein [Alphaproteobacteria bacterium]